MIECLYFNRKDIEKGQMVKWSNIFLTHPFYSSVQANNNIYIIINYYIYIIIEEEVRKIWGVFKKRLTI